MSSGGGFYGIQFEDTTLSNNFNRKGDIEKHSGADLLRPLN